MPVTKFRSVEDMPTLARVDGPELLDRVRASFNRAFTLCPPSIPRGVQRFATIEDANRARAELLAARMRRQAASGDDRR